MPSLHLQSPMLEHGRIMFFTILPALALLSLLKVSLSWPFSVVHVYMHIICMCFCVNEQGKDHVFPCKIADHQIT